VARSRQALRAALLRLLEERRFDQITVREITAHASTGYATFFRHYPDTWALLHDVGGEEIRHLIGFALPLLRVKNARVASLALCQQVEEHRPLWTALLTGGAAGAMRDEFIRQAKALPRIRAWTSAWLPTDLKVRYSVSGLFEVLAWWLQDQPDCSPEQVAEILDRLIMAPMTRAD
jgi:AcrR family transcriptional regulator